jgi:pimeloyl-ACP methyl ester carboxylesterase
MSPARTFVAAGRGIGVAKLRAAWRLFDRQLGRRAGVIPLEAFDPDKRPIVMIHGLGGSPLAWSRLSQAVQGDPVLRDRFQVWHVLYRADAPMVVIRHRVQRYLDDAWRKFDPGERAPARSGMVLIGHSLGGVVARMLCSASGETLWSTAFTVPREVVQEHSPAGTVVGGAFCFQPYPGVSRAIFLAAPHGGSPNADRWMGRFLRTLVGGRAPEIQGLCRFARAHPEMMQAGLRAIYQRARVNSIASLQPLQPMRRASEALMPAEGIPYHVIAAVLPGSRPPGDGAVPLSSALLPGAASTLVVEWGHDVYDCEQVVADILRILREDLLERT